MSCHAVVILTVVAVLAVFDEMAMDAVMTMAPRAVEIELSLVAVVGL